MRAALAASIRKAYAQGSAHMRRVVSMTCVSWQFGR